TDAPLLINPSTTRRSSDIISVGNTGAITSTGAITTTANGNIFLLATGTVTIGAVVTAGGSGNILLSGNAATSDVIINANVSSTTVKVQLAAVLNDCINACD